MHSQVDLEKALNSLSLAMGAIFGTSPFRLAVVVITLSSCFAGVRALPALPLSPMSSVQTNTSSLLVPLNTRPPEEPTCPSTEEWGVTLGHPLYNDCDYILSNLYPRDPPTKPVLRNFYVAPADVSHTLGNFKLPYEQSYRTCNIQLLLAADFNNVPHDEATWNDLRGATRTVFRTCIRGRRVGGVVTKNGHHGNLEIVVYGNKSIFAKNQILKNSPDPLARSIAAQELLELMNVVMVPTTPQSGFEMGTAGNETVNVTIASGSATARALVETS